MMSFVAARDVRKALGPQIIRGVSLDIRDGEFVMLVGSVASRSCSEQIKLLCQ
jgi:ABC-type sugar transport system ATPase subunit